MKVRDFRYDLPPEAIAQTPHTPRDDCRLLVVSARGALGHQRFTDIVDYLQPGDVLVVNTTRVIPARLYGRKEHTGGKVELLLLFRKAQTQWECLARPLGRLHQGTRIVFPGSELTAEITQKENRTCLVTFTCPGNVLEHIHQVGQVPLPPYIHRRQGPSEADRSAYQTVYAADTGAVAAPTAGLHFTEALLARIHHKAIPIVSLVLHTSWASFFSLTEERLEKNRLPAEYYRIPLECAQACNTCKQKGGRVFAVGTTTVRALETAGRDGIVQAGEGWTDLFIYPGYSFQVVDALITNFHIPASSLLVLTCAFVGKERLLRAYKSALERGYRFLSYGDATLLFPPHPQEQQL